MTDVKALVEDFVEDQTVALSEEIFRVQMVAAGRPLDQAERILVGRDREVVLLPLRELAEARVRAIVSGALDVAAAALAEAS